jgi:hypothetical protein
MMLEGDIDGGILQFYASFMAYCYQQVSRYRDSRTKYNDFTVEAWMRHCVV